MIEHLLRAGLAWVDDGLTPEMVWRNVLGRSHGGPPVRGSRLPCGWAGASLRRGAATRTGAQDASIAPVAENGEKLTENTGRDSGAWTRGGAIGVIRGGRGDAENDAVSVLDFKGQGFSRRAVLDRYLEGAPIERVREIDDGDGLDLVLTVHAARGIKKIPRSSCAYQPAWWRGKRGPRRSVQTWAFLHDGDQTAKGLRVEPGGDGDPTSIGKDEFEVGSGGGGRQDRIGNDGDREEVVIGTGGRIIVAGGGLGCAGLTEVLSKRSEARSGAGGRTRLESNRCGGNH
jgi:hypothetical protein